ncbi:hypothetical protein NCER_101709 [Vairimorpha ceranae BRL01]|uniref:Uncharacterized protein n=1 Tax=Vairimorpha ceranae (strain BRL01) TaxID=578460 RepID=C4VAL3_VAIC1|nr:hypothetical protein NCER_101709 [Vairimorpha ceranae BRL01]
MLSLEQIEKSILFMDETYDANFGEWIRNEDNCRIIAYNMKKYIDKYSVSNMIVVIKWIVKDWTLKSIIIFTKKMLFEDIKNFIFKESDLERKKFHNRIKIVSGLIYTWNSLFISEFIIATTKIFSIEEKSYLLKMMLESFDQKKFSEIMEHLDNKMEFSVKNELSNICGTKKRRPKRSRSIIEAYNVS